MCVGGLLRRVGVCRAKRDIAGLDLLAEPIELFPFLRVSTHESWREADIRCGTP
jgi:hypothetical protein